MLVLIASCEYIILSNCLFIRYFPKTGNFHIYNSFPVEASEPHISVTGVYAQNLTNALADMGNYRYLQTEDDR